MADRILGMGDTINLVRKAEELIDKDEMAYMEEKVKKASFTYNDLLKQFGMIKKMGSMKSLMGMMPGMSGVDTSKLDEKQFLHMEAIILSMTPRERKGLDSLEIPRRRRIAKGAGRDLEEVNRLVKMYTQSKDFLRKSPNRKKLEKMMGGKTPWR
jgi:signal recognition particle subunit SRP54